MESHSNSVYFTPLPGRPLFPISTKFAGIPHINDKGVIKCTKFGLNWFTGVQFVGSQNWSYAEI